MNKIIPKILSAIVISVVMILGLSACNEKQENTEYRIIQIVESKGKVIVDREGKGEINAYNGMKLQNKDRIIVAKESSLRILIDKDKYIYVEPETVFSVLAKGNNRNSKTSIHIEKGAMTTEIQNSLKDDSSYDIVTPNSTMSVRGTVYYICVDEDENKQTFTTLNVFAGKVGSRLIYPNGKQSKKEVLVEPGKGVIVRKDETVCEYIVFDSNKIKKDVSLKDLRDETLNNLKDISSHKKKLFVTGKEILEEIESRKKKNSSNENKDINVKTPLYQIGFYNLGEMISQQYLYERDFIAFPTITRKGYDFDGWYMDKEYTRKFKVNQMPSINLTVYAKWNAQMKTISFYDQTTQVNSITAYVGSSISLPKPQRAGYNFKGWYRDSDFKENYATTIMPTKSITLYARWEARNDIPYVINTFVFNAVENTYLNIDSKTWEDGTPGKLIHPRKEMSYNNKQYVLKEQPSVAACTIKNDGSLVLNLYYIEKHADYYFVTFQRKSGETIIQSCKKGEGLTEWPMASQIEGFSFKGWNTNKDGIGIFVDSTWIPDKTQTLYEIQVDYVPYNVIFQMQTFNNGSLDYEVISSMTMLGKPNQRPVLEKFISEKSMIMDGYEFIYPSNLENININGTSTYLVSLKYNKPFVKVNYHLSDTHKITKYYRKDSLFIGLDSASSGNVFGFWKKDGIQVPYLTNMSSFENEVNLMYEPLQPNHNLFSYLGISEIWLESTVSGIMEKQNENYYIKEPSIFYTGDSNFGYQLASSSTVDNEQGVKVSISHYKLIKKSLYYCFDLLPDSVWIQPLVAEIMHKGKNIQLANMNDYLYLPNYRFKGWQLLDDDEIPVDDCFVTAVNGCFGNLKVRAIWVKRK